jgi:DNA-directed RNA polymerase II subunit RPB1
MLWLVVKVLLIRLSKPQRLGILNNIQRRLVKALEDVRVRNSLGDFIRWTYGKDGIDGAFIEKQTIETFGLNDREFEHNYRVDVTDPAGGFLPSVLQVGVDERSLELQVKFNDEEYGHLVEAIASRIRLPTRVH